MVCCWQKCWSVSSWLYFILCYWYTCKLRRTLGKGKGYFWVLGSLHSIFLVMCFQWKLRAQAVGWLYFLTHIADSPPWSVRSLHNFWFPVCKAVQSFAFLLEKVRKYQEAALESLASNPASSDKPILREAWWLCVFNSSLYSASVSVCLIILHECPGQCSARPESRMS